jgi:endonuclease YncB( thermonuclease family)
VHGIESGPRRVETFIALLVFAATGMAVGLIACERSDAGTPAASGERASVTAVTDGDTLVVSLNGRSERVRLLGVDTPETSRSRTRPGEYLAGEAAEFTREEALSRDVILEGDPRRNDRDDYGRLLRYVTLPDGRCLNAELVRNGLGYVFTRYPFAREKSFLALQTAARESGIGLWAAGGRAELSWNLARGIDAVRLHPMTNRSWAIEYAGHVKPRVRSDRLVSELNELRRLTAWNGEEELESSLRREGYLVWSSDRPPRPGGQAR